MDPNENRPRNERPRRGADLPRYYKDSQQPHYRYNQSYHATNSQPVPPSSCWSTDILWQQSYVRFHNTSWRASRPNNISVPLLEHCPQRKPGSNQRFSDHSTQSGKSHSKISANSSNNRSHHEKNTTSSSRAAGTGEFPSREPSHSSKKTNPKNNPKSKDLDNNKAILRSASTAALADKVKASLKLLKRSKSSRGSLKEKELSLPNDGSQNKGANPLCSTNPSRPANPLPATGEQQQKSSTPSRGGSAWASRQSSSSDGDPNKLLEGIGFIQKTATGSSNTVEGVPENNPEGVEDCDSEQLSPASTESVSSEKLAVFKQKELTNILLMDKAKRKQHVEQPTNTSKIIMEHLVRESLNAQSRQLSHMRFRINPDEHSLYNELIEMEEIGDIGELSIPVDESQNTEEDIQILAMPPKETPPCIELDIEENIKVPISCPSLATQSKSPNNIVNEKSEQEVSRVVVSSEARSISPVLDRLSETISNTSTQESETSSSAARNEICTFEHGTQTDNELLPSNQPSSHVSLPDPILGSNRIAFLEWLKEEERIWNEIRSIDVCIKELMAKRDALIQKMGDKKCQFLCSFTPYVGMAPVETEDVPAGNQIPEIVESPASIVSPGDSDPVNNTSDTLTKITEEDMRKETIPTPQMVNLIEKLRENGINVAVGNTVITVDLVKKNKADDIVEGDLPSPISAPEEKRKKKSESDLNETKKVKLDPDSMLDSAVNTASEQIESNIPQNSPQVVETNTEQVGENDEQPESSVSVSRNDNSTVENGKRLESHEKAVCCMHLQGPCLITASEDKTIHVYDLKTGEVLLRVLGHQMPVTGLYTIFVTECGFRKPVTASEYLQQIDLITAGLDGCVRQISLSTGKLVREINCQHPINCLGYSRQHGNVLLLGSSVGFIYLYKPKQVVMKLANFQAESEILCLHMCRLLATKVVVIAARRSPLAVRDFHTGILLLTLTNHVAVNSVYCITVLGDFVYSGDSARSLVVYDTANSGKVVDSVRMPAAIVGGHQDGRYVYLACKDGIVRIYDSKKHSFISDVSCPPMGPLTCMQIKGNEKIICGSAKGELAWIPLPEL